MKLAKIGQVVLGEGQPKICVSITGATTEEVLKEAQILKDSQADIVEWRLDFLAPEVTSTALIQLLAEVKKAVAKPLLLTFRTGEEGGERPITPQAYLDLCRALLASRQVAAIDLELHVSGIKELIELAHDCQTTVIISNHDFQSTPTTEEILGRLQQMADLGGDVAKLAAMPQEPEDVLRLLAGTLQAARQIGIPVVTMSMGSLGKISRVSGATFGSAMTFGAQGMPSAPGQLGIADLRKILEQLAN